MDAKLAAALYKIENERRAENAKIAARPCSKADAEKQYQILRSWSKGKAISRFTDESCNFWKCGKWMTKIMPDEISGMVKHGFARLDGNRLILQEHAALFAD